MFVKIISINSEALPEGQTPPKVAPLAIAKSCESCRGVYCPAIRARNLSRYCGTKCSNRAAEERRRGRGCLGCGVPGDYRHRAVGSARGYCKACRPRPRKEMPFNKATEKVPTLSEVYANKDYSKVVELLHENSDVDLDTGCWIWRYLDKKGYGKVKVTVNGTRKTLSTHRLSLEAKIGRPFVEHSHHACANTKCCNPDHLQLATANENVAEMLARRSYEARIK